jgi:uncharacterized protein (TIGR03067 family)
MTTPRLVLLALVAAPVVAAPVPKVASASDLDGRWEVTEWRLDNLDATTTNRRRWEVKGETLTVYVPGEGGEWVKDESAVTKLVRPDAKKPEVFDYHREWRGKASVFPGRYALDGDTLTVCYANGGGDRPSDLTGGKGITLVRFKRVKEK